jgi:hypothetical protein
VGFEVSRRKYQLQISFFDASNKLILFLDSTNSNSKPRVDGIVHHAEIFSKVTIT